MSHSPEIDQIAAALAGAQADLPVVTKSQTAKVPTKGGSYSYSYASLSDVVRAGSPVLAKHGLAFTASPDTIDGRLMLVGRLIHTSGQWISGELPLDGRTPQEIGSALTYGRRYLYGALTGLVTDDDDDGELATRAAERRHERQQHQRQAPERQRPTADQVARLRGLFAELHVSAADQIAGAIYIAGREVSALAELDRDEVARYIEFCEGKLADQVSPPTSGKPDTDYNERLALQLVGQFERLGVRERADQAAYAQVLAGREELESLLGLSQQEIGQTLAQVSGLEDIDELNQLVNNKINQEPK